MVMIWRWRRTISERNSLTRLERMEQYKAYQFPDRDRDRDGHGHGHGIFILANLAFLSLTADTYGNLSDDLVRFLWMLANSASTNSKILIICKVEFQTLGVFIIHVRGKDTRHR
jgi:hypothetical protein